MSMPTPLFAILDNGQQVKIENALRRTRKPIVVFDKEKYRDKPTPVVASAGAVDAAAISAVAGVAGIGFDVTEELAGDMILVAGQSSIVEEDDFTHVPKRNVPKLDTLVEFWDDEDLVGLEMKMSVTVAMDSAEITVPDATLLTPGQKISAATLIPADTIILSILSEADGVIDTTKAKISQAATGDGTVLATLEGSNLVGEFKESEFLAWGEEISTPT